MRAKTRIKVGKNPLTDAKLRRYLRDQSLGVAQSALPIITDRLNKSEVPDPDPRRSHINVKKWNTKIVSQHQDKDELAYVIRIRATNTQAPTTYTAYRRIKQAPEGDSGPKPRTTIYNSIKNKPLTREEVDDLKRFARSVYRASIQSGFKPSQAKAAKEMSLKGYKRLVAVKVRVDNIAFSRLFSSKNTIKPNPSKYGPYTYSRCLKMWNTKTNKFEYSMYSNPIKHNDNYYDSRVHIIKQAISDSTVKLKDEGEWK